MNYIEEYRFADRHLGISRENDPPKYKVWVGGNCVNSTAGSLLQARTTLATYIEQVVSHETDLHERKASEYRRELQQLKTHPAGILHFIIRWITDQGGQDA